MTDISEASDFLDQQRQAGLGQAVTSVDNDPEAAARAIQIGKASGVPPIVVHDDLEGYEAQHKAALTHDILRNNSYLQAYAAHDPMAAKVSSDDWGQLDTIHQSLDKLGPISVGQKMAEGFVSGVGPGGIGSWIKPEDVEKYPLGSIGYAILGAPVEVPLRLIGGIMEAGARGAGEMYSQVTGDREGGRRIGEDLLRVANDPFWIAMMHSMGTGGAEAAKGQTAAKAFEVSRPYLEAGKEPPTGLHPLIDQMKQKQSELELKALEDLTKEAQKSATRERAPEMFEKVIELKNQGVIGISADAVAKLYGDKLPKPDDNVLGWIPDLEKQMYLALSSGGDIEVPIAKWATYVDPEIAKQLHDDIRPRKGGVTKAEGEVLKQQFMVEAYHGSPHEFDAFSMEKIGTGDGAQSYGHGLYFAENQEVAQSYKDKGAKFLDKEGKDVTPGALYKVKIHADKEQFLDWDKPLSEQTPHVKDRLAQFGLQEGMTGNEVYTEMRRGTWTPTGEGASLKLKEAGIPGIKYLDQGSRPTARSLKVEEAKGPEGENLFTIRGDPEFGYYKTKAEADARLEELQPSSYNFVLFDDSLIEITHKNEQAVANVRIAAKLDPLFERGIREAQDEVDLEQMGSQKIQVGDVEAWLREHVEGKDAEIMEAIEQEGKKLGLKGVDVGAADKIVHQGEEVGGTYTQFTDRTPLIFYALTSDDPKGYFRHEAIHHLRQMGFFKEGEWDTLVAKAMDEDWIKKHNIDERYPTLDKEGKFEEAIAEEFRNRTGEYEAAGRLRKFLDAIKAAIKRILGYEPDANELFRQVEQGKIGERTEVKPLDPTSFDQKLAKDKEPANQNIVGGYTVEQTAEGKWEYKDKGTRARFDTKAEAESYGREVSEQEKYDNAVRGQKFAKGPGQGELDVTRQEDKKLFATIAGWMNKAQQAKYMDLIAKRNAEDVEFQLKKAERLERKRQSEEWKQNEAEMRPEVEKDVRDRPDMQALEFFRSGKLYGEETGTRPRVDPSKLTEEQRKAFPEKYQRRDGMNPSDVANLFGYTSFDELAAKLTQRDTELGSKTTAQFMKGIVDKELEQRMLAEYGDKEENILREAQEHVISPTQMDLLYEQVVAFGMRAGSKMSFTKADFKAWVQEGFKDAKAAGVSVENYLRDSGKTGRDIRDALLKGDPLTAFKQEQRQLMAMMMADEAIKFEKLQGRTERLMNKYARRANVPSIAQEYTDQVHQLLKSVGDNIRRTEANIALSSQGKSLADFIAEKNAAGDGIMDPMLPPGKALKDFTVEEYTAFANTLKSLDYNGKEAKTIQVGWDKLEKSDAIEGVVESLEPLKKFDIKEAPPKGLARRLAREVDARLIKVEQLADWIDHNDPRGWFNQTVVRPLYSALHKRGDTIAKLAEDVKAIPVDREWGRALNDAAGNTLLRDAEGRTIPLTNENKIAIALNMGNESNKSVLLRGHKWDEASVTSFLQDKMTDMDWAFVEGIWKMFDKIAPFVTEATTKRTGVPIEMVQPSAILGHKGGYYPLIKDPLEALVGKQVETDLVDKPFFDPLPMARALKLRTGIAYPLDLSINSIASRINETLHAALFQDPIRNARKVTSAEPVRRGIAEAFGPEYMKQIDAWLKDIANNGGENSDAQAAWFSRNLRENVVYGLMAYKVSTAAIHALSAGTASAYEVGPVHLAKNMKDLGIAQIMPDVARRFFANEKQMWEQVDWAHETFPELRTRMQDIGRDMQAQLANVVKKGLLDDAAAIRAKNIVWGMKMVATLDQLTATPVAIAAYRKAIAEGWNHEDAAYAGDKAVRTAHGSPSLVGRANIGRGEVNKWLTIAYNGYWNHNYNRSRSAVRDVKNPEVDFTDKLMVGSAAFTAFIIAPAIYHYAIRGSDNDTWTGAASEAILSQFGGQVPIVNTLMHSFMHNRDPHVSPFDTLLEAAYNVKKDIWNLAQGKKADKYLKHVVELPGYFTGLGASGQLGTVAQFNKDVMQNKQRPHSILEWARGEITGEAKPKTKRR